MLCNITHNVTGSTPYWVVKHLATLGATMYSNLKSSIVFNIKRPFLCSKDKHQVEIAANFVNGAFICLNFHEILCLFFLDIE